MCRGLSKQCAAKGPLQEIVRYSPVCESAAKPAPPAIGAAKPPNTAGLNMAGYQ